MEGARQHSTGNQGGGFLRRCLPTMLSPETQAALTLAIAVGAAWAVLHVTAVFMKHQADVAELHRKVRQLRDDYIRRTKSKREEQILEVGEAA